MMLVVFLQFVGPVNVFLFINKFHLAILTDHHFVSMRLFRRVFFFLLEMPVNVIQYRAAIGVFNNRSFITIDKSFYVTETKLVREMSLRFFGINMVSLFLSFFFMLTVFFHQNYRKKKFKYYLFQLPYFVFATLGYIFD